MTESLDTFAIMFGMQHDIPPRIVKDFLLCVTGATMSSSGWLVAKPHHSIFEKASSQPVLDLFRACSATTNEYNEIVGLLVPKLSELSLELSRKFRE